MKNGIDGAKRDKKRDNAIFCKIWLTVTAIIFNRYKLLFQKLQELQELHFRASSETVIINTLLIIVF